METTGSNDIGLYDVASLGGMLDVGDMVGLNYYYDTEKMFSSKTCL